MAGTIFCEVATMLNVLFGGRCKIGGAQCHFSWQAQYFVKLHCHFGKALEFAALVS